MQELDDLRGAITATRSVLKASTRSLRTSLQFLADLEERLAVFEQLLDERKALGGTANEHDHRAGAAAAR